MTRFVDKSGAMNGQAGITAPSCRGWGVLEFSTAQYFVLFARFVAPRNMTATKIAFGVVTASVTNDNYDVGIYSSSLTRLVSKGSTGSALNSGAPKVVEASIASTALQGGTVYYAAWQTDAPVLSALRLTGAGTAGNLFSGLSQVYGITAGVAETGYKEDTAIGLDASYSFDTTGNNVPILAIRES